MKKVLITGADGTLGRVLTITDRLRDHSVFGLTRKKSDYSATSLCQIIDKIKPAIIIHTAGTSSVRDSMADPSYDYNNSVIVFQNILEGVKLSKYRPLVVYLSSAAVYGNPARLPVKETDPCLPISPYGLNKLICEQLAQTYSQKYNFPSLIIRLFSLFGPEQKKLIIWESYRQARDTGKIKIMGTGSETRDYLYLNDACDLICELAEQQLEKGALINIVNVASGKSVRIDDLINDIAKYTGCSARVKYLGIKIEGDPRKWEADISKLRTLIGHRKLVANLKSKLISTMQSWDQIKEVLV